MNETVEKLIRDHYSPKDLRALAAFFKKRATLEIVPLKNGLYPAQAARKNKLKSGYSYVWLRDTVMIANYQSERKKYKQACRTMMTLRDYFFKHRRRFYDIITRSVDKANPMLRPHVRFDGETLGELPEKWAHAQNDALGYALWMVFRLVSLNQYKLTAADLQVWSLFPFYFAEIEFWQDADSGHWEEGPAIKCSSIGAVVAGLEEMKRYLMASPAANFECFGRKVDLKLLNSLIKKGRDKLNQVLPAETSKGRPVDSALLFLVYPLAIVDKPQSQAIIDMIAQKLQGDWGIKRYQGDSYWCADYKKLIKLSKRSVDYSDNIEARNKLLKPGSEAQWCLFDPIMSVIYGRRYLATGKIANRDMQIKYFNRSLRQLTPDNFQLGGGQCPEAYYQANSAKQEYVPNDNTPLAWVQANLGVAFEYLKKTA